jgi:methionyl-tRNA formyltransferase
VLRIVFMGSPEFAVPSLRAAMTSCAVAAVVAQPDKPKGRGQSVEAPAVARVAREAGLPLLQPPSVRRPEVQEQLRGLQADLFLVVAYGKILPPEVLSIPRLGCVNVHASLLPRYRGAAPIQWSLIRGETETGVTLMKLDAGMDTGPMLVQERTAIAENETAGQLAVRLAELGAGCLQRALPDLEAGRLAETPQDHAQATMAPLLEKEDGRVDFAKPARAVRDHVRGVDPWPGAFTLLDGEVLKVFAARLATASGPSPGTAAGEVLGLGPEGLRVRCGDGQSVAFGELQLPGRKRMAASALCAGRPIATGTRLG